MLNNTQAAANRQAAATNLVARHMSERSAKHIVRRVLGELVVWKVESQTTDEVYTVTMERDGWPATTCSCPDHVYRHAHCKHLAAVELLSQPAAPAPIAWTSDTRRNRKRTEIEEEI